MASLYKFKLTFFFLLSAISLYPDNVKISGKIIASDNETIDFASVYLKNTNYGCLSNPDGTFNFLAPEGKYTLVVSAIGYETVEKETQLTKGKETQLDIEISSKETLLEEVIVVADGVKRIKESAYNALAIDAKTLHNTTLDLGKALAKLPGVKLRESGGVGSDTQLSLDGFSGKHIKFFIDGVPLEGVGSSFGINNIPINFADRIEVYRGVVPVSFGADALGEVINIVSGNRRRTFVDASYSYGSFNTHRSYANVGHVTGQGVLFELNAFQNYSDNSYRINTPVVDLNTGGFDEEKIERVKRFHDTYHNETVIAKLGLVGKSFADKLIFGINLSQSDKEIQNGVRQEVVFGEKRRKGRSVMPSLEYSKRNLFTKGPDIRLTVNYNHNITQNIDTATYRYNWRGEKKYKNGSIGEQSYQDNEFKNANWNVTFNANYRIGYMHYFVLNHILSSYDRSSSRQTASTSSGAASSANFDKTSRKNITGLSYRFNYHELFNISVFGKYYDQYSEGPVNTSTTGGYSYEISSKNANTFGYGTAGTIFQKDFQAKVSYEKTTRLPTTDELFGDDDLEMGAVTLKPEKSDNFNFNLSYETNIGHHIIYAEAGFLYRDTKDYIRRSIDKYSGGLYFGSHVNHGRVKTIGFSTEFRYSYSNKFSLGGNVTSQNIRDNEKYVYLETLQESTTYKARIPNIPYFFFNMDGSYHFHNFIRKGNVLSINYDNLYVNEFPLYTEAQGSQNKARIPSQFSHNINLSYSINKRYHISLECRNFTDEKLYDNFSLQKAGRAFYAKFRYFWSK